LDSAEPRLVLINVGVILRAPPDEDALSERLLAVAERLREAVRAAAAAEPDCDATGCSSYHYLGDLDTNAARCAACGAWTTDHDKPDPVAGIRSGAVLNGVFLCEPCRAAIVNREMPADVLRRLPFR